jgi:putative DNA primase/helicase
MAKVIDIDPSRAKELAAEGDLPMVYGSSAIWYPEKPVHPRRMRQDLTTLEYLLSEPKAREQVCGPGDWFLNLMTDEVEYAVQPTPGTAAEKKPLMADDYTQLRKNLEYQITDEGKRLRFADLEVRAVVRSIARRNAYSPVVDYIDSLHWDGEDRMPALSTALGLDEKSQGLELEFLHRWLIAAVARAYRPGCQADTVLVLQGSEGQFKSRFFEDLGGRWFVRMSAELGSKDSIETMRRAWIVELDELDAIKRSREFSTVKANISRSDDDYVPKWIRESQKVKRRSVLGGTVNDFDCLVDEDGLRRFWIVSVRRRINREWVQANRDQLWAQAKTDFDIGEQWHLTPAQEVLQREQVQQYVHRHPWQDLVEQHLSDRGLFDDFVTMQELYAKALGEMGPAQQNGGTDKTLSKILRRLGYGPAVNPTGSGHGRVRGWRRYGSGEVK